METNDINSIINIRIIKAKETIEDARIALESDRFRNALNRIYYANSTLKDAIETFQTKIISVVRGIPEPATTVGNLSVAELSNGDFIVFNTQGSNRQFYLNFSNVSGVLTKDIWDYTNKIYIHSGVWNCHSKYNDPNLGLLLRIIIRIQTFICTIY